MSLSRIRFKATALWLCDLGLLAGAVVLSYRLGSTAYAGEFAALALQKKALVGGGANVGGTLLGEIWTRMTVEFSALAILDVGFVWFIEGAQEAETQQPQSGREKYHSGVGDSIKAGLTRGGENALAVDTVAKRSQSTSVHPTIDRDVSAMFLGQTNTDKSTQAKKLLSQWDFARLLVDRGTITSAPTPRRVIVSLFSRQALSSQVIVSYVPRPC